MRFTLDKQQQETDSIKESINNNTKLTCTTQNSVSACLTFFTSGPLSFMTL